MSAGENLALVRELLEAMRAHDIQKGVSYYAEDSVLDMIPVRGVIRGPKGLASAWGMAWTAFPDQYYKEANMFAYGGLRGVRGRHGRDPERSLPGPATHWQGHVCASRLHLADRGRQR